MPNVIEYGHLDLFADDSGVLFSGEDLDCVLYHAQKDITAISNWAERNYLTINIKKTHYMIVTTPQASRENSISLSLKGEELSIVETSKFLGIIIDKFCRWEPHIQSITKKIASYVGTLSVVRHYVPLEVLKLIYNSYINSRISYGLEIWGTAYNIHTKPLRVLQNKAIRFMTFTNFRDSVHGKYKDLNLMNLNSMYNYKMSLLAYKLVNRNRDDYVFYNSKRNNNNIKLPQIRNNYGHNSIVVNTIKSFNALPEEVKSTQNYSIVRRLIKKLYV